MSNVKCQNFPIESSEALKNLFYRYTHLPLGGKEIVCPYWMNDLENGIYGPLGGKGTPGEIVRVTQEEANKSKVDLSSLSEDEIVAFMKEKRIGVDCSGFVFWMLDAFDKEKGGNGIADDIPNSQGKYIKAQANVKMLTDKNVSTIINEVGEIRIADMLRLRKGRHVAIVTSVCKKQESLEIIYAHSSSPFTTKVSGVHSARIIISGRSEKLGDQLWEEISANNQNYKTTSFFPDFGDGIYRFKNFA